MGDKFLMLGLLIVAGGLVSVGFGYAAHRRDLALQNWPTVPGTIVSCKIVQATEGRLRAPAHSAAPRPEADYQFSQVWTLEVEYRYTVQGVARTGHRATSGHWVEPVLPGNPEPGPRLQGLRAQWVEGAAVAVHYDPAQPAESYLAHVESPGKDSLFRTGLGLVITGLIVVLGGQWVFRHGAAH